MPNKAEGSGVTSESSTLPESGLGKSDELVLDKAMCLMFHAGRRGDLRMMLNTSGDF